MAALCQAGDGIKRVHLVAETAVPIIYLVEKFIIRKVNKSIGPGERQPREKGRVSPYIKRAVV